MYYQAKLCFVCLCQNNWQSNKMSKKIMMKKKIHSVDISSLVLAANLKCLSLGSVLILSSLVNVLDSVGVVLTAALQHTYCLYMSSSSVQSFFKDCTDSLSTFHFAQKPSISGTSAPRRLVVYAALMLLIIYHQSNEGQGSISALLRGRIVSENCLSKTKKCHQC